MSAFKSVLGVCFITLCGCASSSGTPDASEIAKAQEEWNNTTSLNQLQGLKANAELLGLLDKSGEGTRYSALKEYAFSVGMQFGLHQRRGELNNILANTEAQLIRIFDFSPYMLPGNVFPPVVTENKGTLEKISSIKLRSVRYTYHIRTKPQLVIETPTYLNYLVRHYGKPERPNNFLLPKNTQEQKNWKGWVSEGVSIGRKQADLQFESDLNRLKRDLNGVKLFHALVARNVLNMPKLTRQDFGVIKSKDGKTLNIGDEVISLDTNIEYQSTDAWKSILTR